MPQYLPSRAAGARPILPLAADELKSWLASQPPAQRSSVAAWVDSLHFTAKAGTHCLLPGADGDDVGGLAVHLASRVMDEAGAGEILVSRTVRDLVVGSDLRFEDRGDHTLKGFEGNWQLFAVTQAN